jgi:hypothetical protein
MTPRLIRKYCIVDATSKSLLENAITRLGLSARAYDRIPKVSRTLADLEGKENIEPGHVSEAIQYRYARSKFLGVRKGTNLRRITRWTSLDIDLGVVDESEVQIRDHNLLERNLLERPRQGIHSGGAPVAGCAADGSTYAEAVANAEQIIEKWVETSAELGREIPEPRGRLMFA